MDRYAIEILLVDFGHSDFFLILNGTIGTYAWIFMHPKYGTRMRPRDIELGMFHT
jgi:hypothetical protein